ncbi:hypothetical protein GCM10029976_098310 [Kribbella albertanoniae]|uniref:Lipoprotein n=1 Tax=Kribbella albertanoniae TaxID=1266829 RepID=A0A4R4P1U4_9ACTN|nr:hypothetical protein [Kribbella albertanoniae]TDC14537.1 hypothetical protein E1261_42495 [Kribbella albertanoniae]
MHLTKLQAVSRVVVAVAAVGSVLNACSLFGGDKPDDAAPVGYPRSWIWEAAKGISLQAGEAKAVRAWVESQTLYQDSRVSYPGFAAATSAELLDGMVAANSSSQGGGTDRYLVRSLVVQNQELRVSLCSDRWDEFGFRADGSFIDAGTELAVRELVMRKPATTSTPPSEATTRSLTGGQPTTPVPVGRLPYSQWLKGPTTNVFDGWVAASWGVSVKPPPDCIAWFKRNHPQLDYPTGYGRDNRPNQPKSPPPPTLPGSPGW